MQEKLTDNRAPTSSRASSFFIENLLGKGRNGQESMSDRGGGHAGEERGPADRDLHAHPTDSAPAPDGSSSIVWSSCGDSPLQYRGGNTLNFRALETSHSEYRIDCMRPGNTWLIHKHFQGTNAKHFMQVGHITLEAF